jgi:hypothetical protein
MLLIYDILVLLCTIEVFHDRLCGLMVRVRFLALQIFREVVALERS